MADNSKYIIRDTNLRKIIDKFQYSVDDLIRPICIFLDSMETQRAPEDAITDMLENTSLKIEELLSNFATNLQKNNDTSIKNNATALENMVLRSIPQQASTVAMEVVNKTFPLVRGSTDHIIKLDEKISTLSGGINVLSNEINELKKDKLVKQYGSSTKGLECEKNYMNLLQQRLPADWHCKHVGSSRDTVGNMDIELKNDNNLIINVEIKNYKEPVGTNTINKFLEEAIKKNNSAIMISTDTDFVGFYNRKILNFKPNKFAVFLAKNNYNYTDIHGAIEVIQLLEKSNTKTDCMILTDDDLIKIEDDFNEFTIVLSTQKQRTTQAYEQSMDFFKKLEFANTRQILKITNMIDNSSTRRLPNKDNIFRCICGKTYKTEINFNKHYSVCGR